MRALLVYPTHANCREVEEQYRAADVDAVCYPERSTIRADGAAANCWNSIADQAESIGLPVVKAVCPTCPHRGCCKRSGYLWEREASRRAVVAICTHKRAEHTGLAELSSGRDYIAIHENPVGLLRPKTTVTESDLLQARLVVDRVLHESAFPDRMRDCLRVDDDGKVYRKEERGIRLRRQLEFCQHLARVLDNLLSRMRDTRNTVRWTPDDFRKRPIGVERTLLRASWTTKITFSGPAWQFLLSAAAGELCSAAIIVHRQFGEGGTRSVEKSVIGVRHNAPPAVSTTWFNDATITADRLQMILNRQVLDATPLGRLELRWKAVQILRDITRRQSKRTVANVLRGAIVDRPQFRRIGVICHRPHIPALSALGLSLESRIVRSTYFGSGEERSSNAWHRECDLIIVAGTPRVPPRAIAEYLVQVGEIDAACQQPDWGAVIWRGTTESGESVKVKSLGYQDEAWQRAYRELVRAQLVQAVGRGRGILETGCEVLVLSTEECGLPISDAGLEPLNETGAKVCEALNRLTMENANKDYLGNSIVSTPEIAGATGLSAVRVRELLRSLERRGLARKVGERSGWLPVVGSDADASGRAESHEGHRVFPGPGFGCGGTEE